MEKLYEWASLAAMHAARRFVPSGIDAEDIAQEALLALFSRVDRLTPDFWEDESRARAYIVTMVRRMAIDRIRRETKKRSVSLDVAGAIRSAELLDTPGLEADLRSALSALNKDDAALVQYRLAGRSISETADSLGISLPAARAKMQRALSTLRSTLEGELTARPPQTTPTTEANTFPDPEPDTEGMELYLDPGHASESEVRDVLRALNNLHQASGGLGLEFRIDGTFVLARQEVPA